MASKLIGAIVGTFKVGTGVKVGPPIFQPDRPKMTLRGGALVVRVLGDLQSIPMSCPELRLNAKHYDYNSAYSVTVAGTPRITLKGKGYEPKQPDKQQPGRPKITLKAKGYVLNKSSTVQVGKPKLILKGKAPGKVGKAGLVPTIPESRLLVPTAARAEVLVPTAPYTGSGLLVPTSVRIA